MQGTVGKPMPFPTRMVGTLRYAETVAVQSSVTPISWCHYSCNSIYDPYRTGAGHQPYGHDTYATIYNQYTVLKSRMKVQFSQNNSVLTSFTYGAVIEDDIATTPGYDTWRERPTAKSHPLVINAGIEQKPLTLYWDRNKRFPGQDTYLQLSAPFGSSPNEEEFFVLIAQSQTSGTNLGTVYVSVEIDYFCEFYELKDLGNS